LFPSFDEPATVHKLSVCRLGSDTSQINSSCIFTALNNSLIDLSQQLLFPNPCPLAPILLILAFYSFGNLYKELPINAGEMTVMISCIKHEFAKNSLSYRYPEKI